MKKNKQSVKTDTLKSRIATLPEDRILFRSDFPEYHSEFVGSVLSELTNSGVLIRLSQGIYAKPRMSKFGVVLPSVDKIVMAIALRDKAEVIPSGTTALNALGLSTQVPITYTYLTSGSERVVNLSTCKVYLKHGVPKNFCYHTKIISLIVQALKALGRDNIGEEEIQILQSLLAQETDKQTLIEDIEMMPRWMQRIIKPMIRE